MQTPGNNTCRLRRGGSTIKIKFYFGEEMKPIGQYKDFKWKGSFRLEYKYIPQNYIISIDHEAGLFIILIDDGEKSSTNLERNSKEKKDELNAKNIDIAVIEFFHDLFNRVFVHLTVNNANCC